MAFKWRRQYRAGLLCKTSDEKTVLLPVALTPDPAADVRRCAS
jgi:transposase-like protein